METSTENKSVRSLEADEKAQKSTVKLSRVLMGLVLTITIATFLYIGHSIPGSVTIEDTSSIIMTPDKWEVRTIGGRKFNLDIRDRGLAWEVVCNGDYANPIPVPAFAKEVKLPEKVDELSFRLMPGQKTDQAFVDLKF